MRRKRPCRVCGKWFMPNARVGSRQRVCSSAACQRERHRRDCAAWRERNPDYAREGRLREQLTPPAPEEEARAGPMGEVDWCAARDLVGLEVVVILQLLLEVLARRPQDSVAAQAAAIITKTARHLETQPKDEIGRSGRGS